MLRRILIILGSVVGILLVAVLGLHFMGRARLNRAPAVTVASVPIPTDAVAVARGEYLVRTVSECVGCHGENLQGQVFIDGAPIGYVAAPNLTAGAGGIGGQLTDEQWVRVFYNGVGYDGRALAIMPSHWYQHYAPDDLGAMIAYLKQLPPVDNPLEARNITFPGTILFGVLAYNTLPFNLIDHQRAHNPAPPAVVNREYGEYLIQIAACGECHAANFAGNTDPNGAPLGPNLTPGGDLGSWNEADFVNTLRTGRTPGGRELAGEMPWQSYANLTDTDLAALWAYLSSLEALPDNE